MPRPWLRLPAVPGERWVAPMRLTVRRVMVGVAPAALALAAESGRRRYPACQTRAETWSHAEKAPLWLAASHQQVALRYRELAADRRGSIRYNDEQARFFAEAAGHERVEARRAVE